jgi:hypothetical protein
VCVCENSLEARNCKYKILTESDADFHNVMFMGLFNHMRMNEICIFYCCYEID